MSGASLRWTAEGGRPHVSIVIPDTAGCGLPPPSGLGSLYSRGSA